ncbi:hypothetical protein [Streptomyces sp. NPDC057838]|uniref:hypothetical protein n=1 Tax=unclassified Streptomyces TaxID=2593676 RepID=UPI0036B886B0
MTTWRYTAEDRNRDETGNGTVQADVTAAYEAASQDARSKDTPFYNLVVWPKES